MILHDEIRDEYFEWLYKIVCENRYEGEITYRKLLMCLHNIEFRYSIPRDKNRSEDGIDLRWRFAISGEYSFSDPVNHYFVADCLNGPCSVLEMMIALAIRCEENIMDDPAVGNRTAQWFWGMVTSLGLGAMMDSRFDKVRTQEVIKRFLDREYEANGKGGLFTIKDSDCDLRDIEIWWQLCRYLDRFM